MNEARDNCDEGTVFVLVGNQSDREEDREVPREEAEEFMKKNSLNLFFETSAKNGSNVDLAFQEAGKLVFLNYMNSSRNAIEDAERRKLGAGAANGKSGCC
eukprot:TRINITY_DN7876_c0_g1_i1.p1 TRINITY_DN7876_c0_g1~~TRINITY_DN7876_c0_g1_i1.p1  ORF type:complete len:101 (-),score=30.90 TRINITY_DN7876_c0_g1_i1:172-474(-)